MKNLLNRRSIRKYSNREVSDELLNRLLTEDKDKLAQYTDLLYQQALLIEGMPIEDPVALSKMICDLMV